MNFGFLYLIFNTPKGQALALLHDRASFAYGHIFGPKFLSLFPLGGMNLHPSLLPKYRGCSPVPAAILNCDSQTAVTIQTLSLAMDEGDILSQSIVELTGKETGQSLLDYSAKCGAELLEFRKCLIIRIDLLKKVSIIGLFQHNTISHQDFFQLIKQNPVLLIP